MPTFISLLYMVTFASLSLWLLFKEQREIRKYFGIVFVISFLFYLAYYLLNPGIIAYIRLALGIAMLFFGGFILNAFSANKILFVLLLLASLLGLWYLPDIPRIPFLDSDKVSQIKGLDANFEILAELKQGKTFKDIDEIIRKYQLQTEKAFDVKNSDLTDLDDYIVLNIPENQLKNFDNIIQELNDSGQFDAIEHNEVLTLFEPLKISNKKRGKGTSYLNDPELNKLWTTEILQFDSLHQFIAKKNIRPLKKARIAILDTGVEANHSDLSANFVSTRSEYDEDPKGHGTHCAGIAASVSNNRKGIASFAPSNEFVVVTSIQVFSGNGATTQRTIIRGMILAVDSGADIISMSLGGPSNDAAQTAYRAAVEYAAKKGVIIVAAAGNENDDATNKVPASVDGIIAVSATDEQNRKASFSNDLTKIKWGIAAPGVNIFSTMPGSGYDYMSGTSMATPYVAGLLGLMKSIDPTLDTERAFKIINESAVETQSGKKTGRLIQPLDAIVELLN